MIRKFNDWLAGVFSNPDINKLIAVAAVGGVFLWFFAGEIAPLFGGVLIAYLLEGIVQKAQRHGLGRTVAVSLVVLATVLAVSFCLYLLPAFVLQLRGAAGEMPNIADVVLSFITSVNLYLPDFMAIDADEFGGNMSAAVATAGRFLLDNSLGFAVNLFSLFLYLVLLPLLVFFLLKDKDWLMTRLARYFPSSPIFGELWASVDEQFGSYVRGKCLEAAILGLLSWGTLGLFDMNYAFSLSVLIGLSVFVPFVGAIAVTIPMVALAYLQFGAGPEFVWVMLAYTIIQAFDGQILVPLLFSEVVKLHPVAIFAAIIFFGNLWGVAGVFFAIPLASLIKSILLVVDARRTI